MSGSPKLLLTGASGFLGATLLSRLSAHYAVVPLARRGGDSMRKVDLTDAAATAKEVARAQPDIVIHAAAWTSVDDCERNSAQAYAQNVLATAHLVDACRELPAAPQFVFVSTDQVYDGLGPHREDRQAVPRNVYALTKLWAENVTLQFPGALVVRSNFFGQGRKPGEGLASWLLAGLAAGKPVTVFDDVLFNPLYLEDYADLLMALIGARARGVVNLGADGEGLSKAEFAYALAKRFGVPAASAQTGSVESLKLAALRPKDMRMNVQRLRALLPDNTVPTVAAGIDRMWNDVRCLHGGSPKENFA